MATRRLSCSPGGSERYCAPVLLADHDAVWAISAVAATWLAASVRLANPEWWTSWPAATRSLRDRYLDMRDVHFVAHAALGFLRGSRLAEQRERFLEVIPRRSDGVSLTDDIHFWQGATYPSPSRSMIAVSLLVIGALHRASEGQGREPSCTRDRSPRSRGALGWSCGRQAARYGRTGNGETRCSASETPFALRAPSILPALPAPLLPTRTAQDVRHGGVSLVARVLEQRPGVPLHRGLGGPRRRPRGRVADREVVEQRVRVDPREPLDEVGVLGPTRVAACS